MRFSGTAVIQPFTAAAIVSMFICSILAAARLGAETESSFVELREQTKMAEAAGQYREAERLVKEGLSVLGPADPLDQAVLWNELGAIHEKQNRLDEAEHDFNNAQAVDQSSGPADEEQRATALSNLAAVDLDRGYLSEAEKKARSALDKLSQAALRDSPVRGLVMENFAVISHKEKKDDAALRYYGQATDAILKAYGGRSREYVNLLIEIGIFDFDRGDYVAAREKDTQALDLIASMEPTNKRQKAIVENNLGLILSAMSNFREADNLLTDSVALLLAEDPAPGITLTQALNSLAIVQMNEDKLQAAQEASNRALNLANSVPGARNALAATVYNTMGCLELHQKNFSAAREDFDSALRLWTEAKGASSVEYASTLTNLGTLEDHVHNHKQAEVRYRAALAIYEAQLGPEHPQVATALTNVAAQLYARRKFEDCLQLYERARTIQEKSFGASSAAVASTWRDIALVEFASKRYVEAADSYGQAVAAYKESPAANGPDFAICLREYAALLRALNRFSEAEQNEVLATRIQVKSAIASGRTGPANGFLFQ